MGVIFFPQLSMKRELQCIGGWYFLSLWRNSTIFALRVVSKAFLWQDSLLCLSLMRPVCSTAPHCSLMSGAFRSLVGLQDWNNLLVLLCCFHDVNQEHREEQRFTALCGTCNHTQDRRVCAPPENTLHSDVTVHWPAVPFTAERWENKMIFSCCKLLFNVFLLLFSSFANLTFAFCAFWMSGDVMTDD